MYTEIGAFEAKTRLSEILRQVEQGARFTITVRGRAMADLVPASGNARVPEVSKAVHDLLSFPRVKGVQGDEVIEWIREGRE